MPDQAKLRLLLIDDHSLFREGLSRLLTDEPNVELVAQSASVEELARTFAAPAVFHASMIDLMLLDFDLGERNGLDALQHARMLGFRGRVLLVTAGMSPSEVDRARRQGVSGIFLKHSPPSELLQAIRLVMQGESWPNRGTAHDLLNSPAESHAGKPDNTGTPALTARERAVLRGVFEGRANKEIAAQLLVSEGSVKAVLQQLFAKTGVRSRAQLVRIALENRYEYQLEID